MEIDFFEYSDGFLKNKRDRFELINSLKIKIELASNVLEDNIDIVNINNEEQENETLLKMIKTSVFVDNIPIWSNENSASLLHLKQSSEGNSGAIPIIDDWCCGCNIDSYNGVLYYHIIGQKK